MTIPCPFPVVLRLQRIFVGLLLVCLGTLIALALCEGMLRCFYPKFKYAADSRYEASATRIWVRTPNTRYTRLHPDTGRPHPVIHNNLGLRQHRDFPPGALQSATNVAFFGDSFTENLRLPAPYAFTEPLDYLLNRSDAHFNVLNFGVDGYGTDQAYLAYRDFPERDRLKHVFYIFCSNDVRNIRESRLFTLGPDGGLVMRSAQPSSWSVRLLARLHLTYLVISAFDTLANRPKDRLDLPAFVEHESNKRSADLLRMEDEFRQNRTSPELTETLRLLEAVVRRWQREVEAQGGRFHIVILPLESERAAAAYFTAAGFPVINLGTGLEDLDPGPGNRPIIFQNDGHWNERGNMLAAMRLRQFIGGQQNLPPSSPAEMRRALETYYAAFDGWMPGEKADTGSTPAAEKDRLRRKYTALE